MGVDWKNVRNLQPRDEKSTSKYKNDDNDTRGPWRLGPIFASGERHTGLMYTVTTPSGRKVSPPAGSHWRMTEEDFWKLVEQDRVTFGKDGKNVPYVKLFLNEVQQGLVPRTWWPANEVGHSQDGKRELQAIFDRASPFDTPKPTKLVRRIVDIATDKDSLVMDSFSGSGTTGHAVMDANLADGGQRRCILVELDPSIAQNVTAKRLECAMNRFPDQISKAGGDSESRKTAIPGFRYCRLGRTLLDEHGNINGDVPFADLARYVYLLETGVPIAKRPQKNCPLLGVHRGRAVYLLYSGVLGDRRPRGGNVLTSAILAELPPHPDGAGDRVVYGEACRLGEATLRREQVTFRQIPYSLREA